MILSRPLLALALAAMVSPLPLRAADEDAGAYLAARSAVIASDYREAATWFNRALLVDPGNPRLLDAHRTARPH